MARIRTIKPEFPQSESMGRVSRNARLLFIMLWTICDDSGRARGNSRMLASLLFPYDEDAPSEIDGWLEELEQEECLVRYSVEGSTYLQICKWLNHQKIDKPSQSKIPPFDESSRIFSTIRERSPLDLGSKDLRIKDQGRDQGKDHVAQPSASCEPEPEKKETALQAACKQTWESYCNAYYERYSVEPVRNAKVNSQIKQFCQALPHDEAPHVASFYVKHNQAFYVRKGHDTGLMVQDAAKLRTEWATGRKMTSTMAAQIDRTTTTLENAEQVKREMGYMQ